MFQVEKEDVQREKEDQCICIPKTSMVAMVLLVLRYIYMTPVLKHKLNSSPIASQCFLSVFVVCKLVCRFHLLCGLYVLFWCAHHFVNCSKRESN